jgi:hypothetical protein
MHGRFPPYVRRRAGLDYLLGNMCAEAAIGHCYVCCRDVPEVPAVRNSGFGARPSG